MAKGKAKRIYRKVQKGDVTGATRVGEGTRDITEQGGTRPVDRYSVELPLLYTTYTGSK